MSTNRPISRQILRMSGAGTDPDPAVYCPANNYTPTFFTPDPDWMILGTPGNNEILILMSDKGDRRICFITTLASGALTKTIVEVYGNSDNLINTQVVNSGTRYLYTVPIGQGKAHPDGFTTYKIRIRAEVSTNIITGWTSSNIIGETYQYWRILEVKFGTEGLTSWAQIFPYLYDLKKVSFPETMNSLTNGASLSYLCYNIEEIILPKYAPNIISLASAFSNLPLLKKISLPAIMNSLTTMSNTFSTDIGLIEVDMPTSVNLLDSLTSTFYGCTSLSRLTLPASLPKLTSMLQMCNGCFSLKSITHPITAPLLNSLSQAHTNNYALVKLVLPDIGNELINISSMCSGCRTLESVSLPSLMNKLVITTYAFYSCTALKKLIWPASLPEMTMHDTVAAYCTSLTEVVLPVSMPKVTSMAAAYRDCTLLSTGVSLPATMNLLANLAQAFMNCIKLPSIVLPTTMNALTTLQSAFQNCNLLQSIILPAALPSLTNITDMAGTTTALTQLTLPNALQSLLVANMSGFMNASGLSILNTTTWPALQFAFSNALKNLQSFNQPTLRVTTISLRPQTGIGVMTACEIDWANSTFSHTSSPQINISNQSLPTAEIDRIFTALPVVSGKTINATGNIGYATCNKAIATAKGWTVT